MDNCESILDKAKSLIEDIPVCEETKKIFLDEFKNGLEDSYKLMNGGEMKKW